MLQLSLTFTKESFTVHTKENTKDNQKYLDENSHRFVKQNKKLFELFLSGGKFTNKELINMTENGKSMFGDPRARIRDLRNDEWFKARYKILDEWVGEGKRYWLEKI